MLIGVGESQEISVHVHNYKSAEMKAEVALVGPGDWTVSPNVLTLNVPPKSSLSKKVKVAIPKDWHPPGPRFAIAADVMCDGKYLGQITEAVVDMKGTLV